MNVVGLYGHPVGHSLSPAMHNFAFEKLNLPYCYHAFDVLPEQMKQAVAAIKALNMTGVNVTIPHKETIVQYLDVLDDSAKKIGAVNTIVNQNGILKGFNTDGLGYVMSLEKELQMKVANTKVVLIGSGGAARGIAYALMKHGCTQIQILSRNIEKAKMIAADFQDIGNIEVTGYNTDLVRSCDVIINTTPVGMHPNINAMPIEMEAIHKEHIVSDIVYNPLETKFLQAAINKGARTHKGLGMFVYQGVLAFELWTGNQPPADEMYEFIYQKLIKR